MSSSTQAYGFLRSSSAELRYAVNLCIAADRVVVCDEISAEVRRILIEKFAWTLSRIAKDFEILLVDSQMISIEGAVQGVCRDPKDDLVLECAVNAEADVIVTGDRIC